MKSTSQRRKSTSVSQTKTANTEKLSVGAKLKVFPKESKVSHKKTATNNEKPLVGARLKVFPKRAKYITKSSGKH